MAANSTTLIKKLKTGKPKAEALSAVATASVATCTQPLPITTTKLSDLPIDVQTTLRSVLTAADFNQNINTFFQFEDSIIPKSSADFENSRYNTCLGWATLQSSYNHNPSALRVFDCLLDVGADVNIPNSNGCPPLVAAYMLENFYCFEALLPRTDLTLMRANEGSLFEMIFPMAEFGAHLVEHYGKSFASRAHQLTLFLLSINTPEIIEKVFDPAAERCYLQALELAPTILLPYIMTVLMLHALLPETITLILDYAIEPKISPFLIVQPHWNVTVEQSFFEYGQKVHIERQRTRLQKTTQPLPLTLQPTKIMTFSAGATDLILARSNAAYPAPSDTSSPEKRKQANPLSPA